MSSSKRIGTAGGNLVSQGAYGCTFYPAFPCETDTPQTARALPRIGKVMGSEEHMQEEIKSARILSNIDPESQFFYYADIDSECILSPQTVKAALKPGETCEAIERNLMKSFQITMPFGGKTLTQFLKATYGKHGASRADIARIVEPVFQGIKRLVDAGYVHQDIKPENIVAQVDAAGKTQVRIIDFGVLMSVADYYNVHRIFKWVTNAVFKEHKYIYNGPEYRAFWLSEQEEGVDALVEVERTLAKTPIKVPGAPAYDIGTPSGKKSFQSLAKLWAFMLRAGSSDTPNKMKEMKASGFAEKADIWSLGIVLLRLMPFVVPAEGDNPTAVELYDKLLNGLLVPHPADRMSIDAALALLKKLKKATTAVPIRASASASPSPTRASSRPKLIRSEDRNYASPSASLRRQLATV